MRVLRNDLEPDRQQYEHIWEALCDGKARELVQGEDKDFTCTPKSFRSICHTNAGRRGMKARTKVVGNKVQVQWFPLEAKRKRAAKKRSPAMTPAA